MNSSTSIALEQRVEQQIKLQRFLLKLLQEALHHKADMLVFSLQNTKLAVSIYVQDKSLKTIEIDAAWYAALLGFFSERLSPFAAGTTRTLVSDKAKHSLNGTVLLRTVNGVLSFHVAALEAVAAKKELHLKGLSMLNVSQLTQDLGLPENICNLIDNSFKCDSGILVLAAPQTQQLLQLQSTLLGISGFLFAGRLQDISVQELAQVAARQALIVTVPADDISQALLLLQQTSQPYPFALTLGLVCGAYVARTCEACARKTPIDKALLDVLPPELAKSNWESYSVGRGCALCGERGARGQIAVAQSSIFDENLRHFLQQKPREEDLVNYLFKQGILPLLALGVKLVEQGKTTLNAVFEVAKTLPAAYLPLLRARAQKEEKILVNDALFSPENIAANKKVGIYKVLVVEDDADQRAILAMALKHAGYQVILAENGALGLSAARKDLPDMILTDLMMPVMDGVELVRTLKADAELKNIPIMVLTVLADSDKEFSLLDLGAEEYCDKTVQRKILLKRVENLLRRHGKG